MRHVPRVLLAVLAGLTGLALPASFPPAARAQAPDATVAAAPLPLPDGSRALLLVTGADAGYLRPRGCHAGAGGAQYRPAFARLLKETAPGIPQVWISTGGISEVEPGDGTVPPSSFYRLFRSVGYAAAGVGPLDLEATGPVRLVQLRAEFGLPLLASNLRVLETGRPALDESVIVETPAGRIAFVGIVPHRPDLVWGDAATGTILTVEAEGVLKTLVPRLRVEAAVDAVVLVASLGNVELDALLRAVPGIDLVLAQHGSRMSDAPEDQAGVPTMWMGGDGLRLGALALGANGRVLAARSLPVDETFPIDPATGEARAQAAR